MLRITLVKISIKFDKNETLNAMTETIKIPKILIYEEFDGHPIYRKGYRDFMLALKTIEEINMGTNKLQIFYFGLYA